MDKAEQIIRDTKRGILEQIKDKLQNTNEPEIYFNDVVFEEIDTQTPQDRKTQLSLIDKADTSFFDSGLIDNSSLERTLITSAYCSIEQNIYNDDFIQFLQNNLNNEKIDNKKRKEIIKEIEKELNKMGVNKFFSFRSKPLYEDNQAQVFIKTSFSIGSITKEDFLKSGLIDKQVLELADSFKILTSNKSINQNALIIEEKKREIDKKEFLFRVYLMEKDKELDIRNLLKLKCISGETGFNLSPSAYIEQSTEQYEQDKPFKKNYLNVFKDKTQFIKQIVLMASELTKRTI